MRRSFATSLVILISVTIVHAQKRSDRQDYELIGKVKAVRAWTSSYKFEIVSTSAGIGPHAREHQRHL